VFVLGFCLSADEVYTKNKRANKLYEQENYEKALSIYEEALLESPENKKLSINKGSAQFRMHDLDKAEESYKDALSIDDQDARADLHYNMGNLFNAQGDQQMMTGGQDAMEKLKAARDSYIKALDIRPSDADAKWNLEITQQKIKQLEKQQKQNKDKKDNKGDKEPSEYAKKIKKQADELVIQRKYEPAYNLMMDLLKKDNTAMAYQQYIARLKNVSDINKM
jgi:tetratricopeptide (TPR) repeat protein